MNRTRVPGHRCFFSQPRHPPVSFVLLAPNVPVPSRSPDQRIRGHVTPSKLSKGLQVPKATTMGGDLNRFRALKRVLESGRFSWSPVRFGPSSKMGKEKIDRPDENLGTRKLLGTFTAPPPLYLPRPPPEHAQPNPLACLALGTCPLERGSTPATSVWRGGGEKGRLDRSDETFRTDTDAACGGRGRQWSSHCWQSSSGAGKGDAWCCACVREFGWGYLPHQQVAH